MELRPTLQLASDLPRNSTSHLARKSRLRPHPTASQTTATVLPPSTYLAPQNEYGLPEKAPEAEYGVPEKDDPKDDEEDLKVEGIKEKLQEEPKKDAEVVSAQGSYYVLLPGSQLQRVQFQTENDVRNMAYTARLEYKDEDRAPIYVYTGVPQYQPSAAYVQLF
uniref:Ecdysteroid regulated protein n=1 Tax=Manduca sexta TaxID=7130 RepID=Q25511_MANSE|nr:ecdysteroid regulated protein [Manduca sexta]